MCCEASADEDALTNMALDAGRDPLLGRMGGLFGSVLEGAKNMAQSERLAISLVRSRLMRARLVLIGADITDELAAQLMPDLAKKKRLIIRLGTNAHAVQSPVRRKS